MKCPADDPGFASHPIHGAVAQRMLVRQVLPFVKHRHCAVDVGAHIGTWTVPLAGAFERVDAIEPQAENRECLKANVADLSNVEVYGCAIGADIGKGALQRPNDNSGTYYLAAGDEVSIFTLDSLIDEPVDLIKLDVEGAEGFALQGATRILEMFRPVVFFEDNGLGARHYGPQWVDPKTVLREHGYWHRGRLSKNELWLPR